MKQTTLRSGGYTILPALFCRRNLNPTQIAYLRGKRYETEKKIVSNEKGVNQYTVEVNSEKRNQPLTRDIVAKEYGEDVSNESGTNQYVDSGDAQFDNHQKPQHLQLRTDRN